MNIQRTFALVKLELRKVVREPAYLFLMILFPATLTLVFGLAFGTVASKVPGKSQFDFMVPGLFAYACIFIIMIVGQTFSDDREKGLLQRINLTPTTSSEFMGSHLISNTILSILQLATVGICAIFIGYRPEGGIGGFAVAFLLMMALSVCSVGFGLIVATISKSNGVATGMSFLFILPQMFFGTIIPLNATTKLFAQFLPSYYVTDAITKIFNGTALTDFGIWISLVIVSLMAIMIVLIGIKLFKKFGSK
jgi:ABC-2 type transport system permease protein